MITLDERSTDRVLGFRISGMLSRSDFRHFTPVIDEAIAKHKTVSVLIHIDALSGVAFGALWEEIKFELLHFRHFERLALVGDGPWHERALRFASTFTPAETRFFSAPGLEHAWKWVMGDDDVEFEPLPEEDINHVLLATDFSEGAAAARDWAIMLAKKHGATLTILHIAPAAVTASLPLDIQAEIAAKLEETAEPAYLAGLEVVTKWRPGKPWEHIIAESMGHDVVVLGARSSATVLHPLGSTADRVLRSAPVPVLTVHPESGIEAVEPRNVLVAIDFSETAMLALEAALTVLDVDPEREAAEKPTLTLLHAWQPLVDYGDGYMAFPQPNPMAESRQQAEEMLGALAERLQSDAFEIKTVVRQGYAAKVISANANRLEADVIVMGTQGHSGLSRLLLGSIAERVVHRVRCPVLTVGPLANRAPRIVDRTGVEESVS